MSTYVETSRYQNTSRSTSLVLPFLSKIKDNFNPLIFSISIGSLRGFPSPIVVEIHSINNRKFRVDNKVLHCINFFHLTNRNSFKSLNSIVFSSTIGYDGLCWETRQNFPCEVSNSLLWPPNSNLFSDFFYYDQQNGWSLDQLRWSYGLSSIPRIICRMYHLF